MDRIAGVIVFQWRAFWRRFARRGRFSAGNQGVVLIIAALVLLKYIQQLRLASSEILHGQTSLFQTLLGALFFAWLMAFTNRERDSDGTQRLLALPLSLRELFFVRISSLLTPPYIWLLLLASLGICYPLRNAPHPLLGSLAALMFVVFSFACGLTISSLLNMRWWRRALAGAGLLTAAITGFSIMRNPNLSFLIGGLAFPPMTWVANVATKATGGRGTLLLAALSGVAAVSLWAAFAAFRVSIQHVPSRSYSAKPILNLSIPGRLGGLVGKDLRHYRRLLDVYLGVLALGAGSFYLISVDVASVDLSIIFLMAVLLPNAPLAFNYFGLDNASGLDRYALLPLRGRVILLSKNLAYAVFLLVQASPLLILTTVRLGLEGGVVLLATTVASLCAYLTWGNIMAISHPVKMHFFRFSSSTSSLIDAMAGIMFSSSPAALVLLLLNTTVNSIALISLVPVAFGVMCVLSLLLSERRLAKNWEKLMRAVA
jgi:hypothetical protein